jgi:hypothetical protein
MDVEIDVEVEGEEEEDVVRTLAQVELGENVRKPGSDVRRGDLVLTAGTVLRGTGGEVGTLVFVGRKEVCRVLSFDMPHLIDSEIGRRISQTCSRIDEHGRRAFRRSS